MRSREEDGGEVWEGRDNASGVAVVVGDFLRMNVSLAAPVWLGSGGDSARLLISVHHLKVRRGCGGSRGGLAGS